MKTPNEEIQQMLADGHTQEELAKAARVSQTSISRWASGATKKISFMAMYRLRRYVEKQKGKK